MYQYLVIQYRTDLELSFVAAPIEVLNINVLAGDIDGEEE